MAEIDPETIAENAAAPRRVQGDSGSAEQHSIPDQIAADKYRRSTAASASRKLPIRYVRVNTGGAV